MQIIIVLLIFHTIGQADSISRDSSTLYCIFVTDSNSGWQPNTIGAFFCGSNPLNTTYNGSNYLNNIRTTLRNINTNQQVGVGDWSLTKNAKFKYIYTQFDWSTRTGFNYQADNEYGADIILTPPITYLEYNNAISDNTHNGSLFTNYFQGDLYSNIKIKLGNILPNDSYYYEIYLKENSSNLIKGTIYCNVEDLNIYNGDGALYLDNNQDLYVTTRLLNYSTQYRLEVTSYYGDGGTNLYEDIDWYIFLPANAVIENGAISSFGSGDYNIQNSTNDIMGYLGNYTYPSGDIQGILNTDGSLLSGDLFDGVQMPVLDGMKNYNLFDLLRAIGDCVGGSGDAYFDFQMHGETPTRIYASQFRTPDGALKTLVSSFLVFFTFYFLVLQLRHVLEMLTTANIKGAIDYVDSSMDNMFYM